MCICIKFKSPFIGMEHLLIIVLALKPASSLAIIHKYFGHRVLLISSNEQNECYKD